MTTAARVHATEARSRANGPGARFVVWLQGCTLGCVGCFNPTTHDAGGGTLTDVDELIARIAGASGITGVTLSGGEPLEQPEATLALLRGVRAIDRAPGLSTLAFSGFTIEEIRAQPLGPEILAELDVLIDGRYVARERVGAGLRGSANQRIQLLTDRYTLADVEATPEAEVRIDRHGAVILTGVAPVPLRRR